MHNEKHKSPDALRKLAKTVENHVKFTPDNCPHCEYDRKWLGHGGWVYHGNNGPIVACPLCNDDGSYPRQ